MNIIFNGEPQLCHGNTLADILIELALAEVRLATAVNGRFIPIADRAATILNEGDRVEALSSMQGG